MTGLINVLLVGVGGCLGAISRYGVQQLSLFSREKFWSTVDVNLIGCFLIGLLWGILNHYEAPRWVYCLAVTGFLGGFTTFSSFSLDALMLLQSGRWLSSVIYILVSVLGGLALCGFALWLTGKFLS
jgi:CrcB protein